MEITNVNKGRTTIAVTISGIPADREVPNHLLIGYAMKAVDEDPTSLFGYTCSRLGNEPTATVHLHID